MGIAFVQQFGHATAGAVASDTITAPGASTAGDLVDINVVTYNGAGITVSLSDNYGNVWTQVGSYVVSNVAVLSKWYAKNLVYDGSHGNLQITITPSASAFVNSGATEYGGADTSAPLTASNSQVLAGTTSPSSGTVTVANSGEVLNGAVTSAFVSPPSLAADTGNGFTGRYSAPTAAVCLVVEDQIVSANKAATFTTTTSSTYAAIAAAYKAAANTTVNVSFSIPVEFLATAQASASAVAEWLGTLASSGSVPAEFLSTIQPGISLSAEWLGTVNASRTAIAEWLATAASGATLPAEWLATIPGGGSIPAEWTGVAGTPDVVFAFGRRGTVFTMTKRGHVFQFKSQ